jgi:hypothetical protein
MKLDKLTWLQFVVVHILNFRRFQAAHAARFR